MQFNSINFYTHFISSFIKNCTEVCIITSLETRHSSKSNSPSTLRSVVWVSFSIALEDWQFRKLILQGLYLKVKHSINFDCYMSFVITFCLGNQILVLVNRCVCVILCVQYQHPKHQLPYIAKNTSCLSNIG
jgi:hypothetical protein